MNLKNIMLSEISQSGKAENRIGKNPTSHMRYDSCVGYKPETHTEDSMVVTGGKRDGTSKG